MGREDTNVGVLARGLVVVCHVLASLRVGHLRETCTEVVTMTTCETRLAIILEVFNVSLEKVESWQKSS